LFAFSGLYEKAKLLFSLRPWHPSGEIVLTRLRWSAAELLPVPPPVRKAPHPGKPLSLLLILGPIKHRQVDHLAVQGQGKPR